MKISIPNLSLIVLIGPSGSGKSTFARKHFLPTEVLSSDACRALVSDEENNQAVTNDAFEVLHFVAGRRLTDPAGQTEGVAWWTELTGQGGEGMVVKPHDFALRGTRGLAQPAVKGRGPE